MSCAALRKRIIEILYGLIPKNPLGSDILASRLPQAHLRSAITEHVMLRGVRHIHAGDGVGVPLFQFEAGTSMLAPKGFEKLMSDVCHVI